MSSACLSEDDVVAFMRGRLADDELASAERHVATCDACASVVAAVAREMSFGAPAPEAGDDPPLPSGARVGRYVVERVVGEGAMGRVYAARDPELDRTVAVKVLHPRVASAELEARLKREAKAMARVSEPEVIAVFDAGRHGKQLFIAMELVDGGTLRDWLVERRRPWREVLQVFLRAGRGLAQAHAAGLIHRDFKPDNVLVGKDGRVRVTDFGLARGIDSLDALGVLDPVNIDVESASTVEAPLTRTGTVLGTPAYMAPEQMLGAPADARSDIYAYAASLYEALYRARPFTASTFAEMKRAKSEGKVRSPPASDVPARVRRAVLVGLAARPEDRYASMAEMLTALERAARSSTPRVAAAIAAVVVAGGAALAARAATRPPVVAAAPAASSAAPKPVCSPAACTAMHDGAPHACRPADGACVPIASEDCKATFEPGDLQADDTLWLGAMFPLTGPTAEAFGRMNADGVEFARKEIADATRTLESANASKHVRRIALVTCDDVANPERAARHLVEDVGVPAIIGFGSGQKLVDLAGPILIPNRVIAIASLSANPLVTRVPQPADLPRMVWRTTYSWHDVAAATARFIADVLEPRVGRPGATRVTVARIDMPAGLWFSEELYRRLVYNGKSAADNGAAYQEVTIPASPPDAAALRALADRVVATRPTFVVLSGATLVTTPLIREVEARWPAGASRPTYVVNDVTTESLASFMGTDVDRRRRVFAISSTSNETPNARFVIRYNAAHAKPVTRYLNPANAYDAFYIVAYATFAVGASRVDGPAIANAFRRLVPPGKGVEVGPMGLFDAIAVLERGDSIDFRGATGALDFDPATGEAPFDFALVCADVDPRGRAAGDVEAGVYLRAASGKIEGQLRCP